MNKKSIGALLLSASLLVAGTASTFAYFTNTADTNTQTITLGDVHVSFTAQTQWKLLASGVDLDHFTRNNFSNLLNKNDEILPSGDNVSNVAPGDVLTKTFTLKNDGKLDAKVKLSLDDIAVNDNTHKDRLLLDSKLFNFKAYAVNADGSCGNEINLTLAPGYVLLDANPGQTVGITVTTLIDNSMTNGGMDKLLTFKLHADATQWNNPGWSESGH
ncbi:CalY family protein [Clostridium sp. YIM B02551]|uniref:CalY family protein n=1 Tax=Clostridium sp. YIM B02551 TaxID=2910679 RepID=UPI001EEA0E56|nr:CalY family protein [Clostridium sp. YIM B02551]